MSTICRSSHAPRRARAREIIKVESHLAIVADPSRRRNADSQRVGGAGMLEDFRSSEMPSNDIYLLYCPSG
jgi:hypothetical protein